jgi:ABC-type iron transport system FetAB permease component
MFIIYIFIGIILGAINHYVMYWTIKKIAETKKIKYASASIMIRLLVLGFCFAYFADGKWQTILLMASGILIAKYISIYIAKRNVINSTTTVLEN